MRRDGARGIDTDQDDRAASVGYLFPAKPRRITGMAAAGIVPLDGYARILLPLWGNGRIAMLLGAVISQ
jgi:hypothetical protein